MVEIGVAEAPVEVRLCGTLIEGRNNGSGHRGAAGIGECSVQRRAPRFRIERGVRQRTETGKASSKNKSFSFGLIPELNIGWLTGPNCPIFVLCSALAGPLGYDRIR